jgi:hypothetical protein
MVTLRRKVTCLSVGVLAGGAALLLVDSLTTDERLRFGAAAAASLLTLLLTDIALAGMRVNTRAPISLRLVVIVGGSAVACLLIGLQIIETVQSWAAPTYIFGWCPLMIIVTIALPPRRPRVATK